MKITTNSPMKALFTLLISGSCLVGFAQQKTTIIYDAHGNIIAGSFIRTVPPTPVTLTDTATNFNYILDSSHIFVTAYNDKGDSLWKTDPWKDNGVSAYRTKRPIIVDIFIGKLGDLYPAKKDDRVIWITYNNTQFGYLDLKTGAYRFCGQD